MDSPQLGNTFKILDLIIIFLIGIVIVIIIYTMYIISQKEIKSSQFLITTSDETNVGIGTSL